MSDNVNWDNRLWFDTQAIIDDLETNAMNELSSIMMNGIPMLNHIPTPGSLSLYYPTDTIGHHADKEKIRLMQRRAALGLDIFTGEDTHGQD
jgi:hypothetical protein|tara:strand:+ start:833 stop:1108 length:276 start_codon:yes stop_codon:yes gene_type:complete